MKMKIDIPQSMLRQMYVNELKTIADIASFYHCSSTTIRRRLKECEIKNRPRGKKQNQVFPNWSANVAYAIGLIATDGNLSKDGRHMTLTSSDLEIMNNFQQCLQTDLQLHLNIKSVRNYYRIQWGNKSFYNWLLEIGLVPCKSSQLGPIKVPDKYLRDFIRGCLDGDGNINIYIDQREHYKGKTYTYKRLSVRFTSASQMFLEWMQAIIRQQIQAHGGIFCHKNRTGQHPYWDLKFGKNESIQVLHWIYYSPDIPFLSRKFDKALPFLITE